MEAKGARVTHGTVLVLFFLSGACGLVYEVVWMRMLTLVFGATAFAAAAILASYFAGLALGSLLFGRLADRSRNPLALYALMEVGVGVFAFLMPVLFAGVTGVYVAIAQALDLAYYPMTVVRLVLSFLVLLIPTTLMGGTLPVMVAWFTRRGVNTFGAVVGTLAAGFFLILLLGVREAAYLAGAVNLAIAGGVWWLSRRSWAAVDEEASGAGAPSEGAAAAGGVAEGDVSDGATDGVTPAAEPAHLLTPAHARLALWAVGVSGVCALALEVFWTRSLVYFLDNSTHAFTTMLTAFLLGIALGSALIARFIDRRKGLLLRLGVVEVLIGLSALAAIPVLSRSTPVMEQMMGVTADDLLAWKWIGLRFVTSLAVMLVPTVLMGMTVPLVARIYTRSRQAVGSSLGKVYSVNTLGGVLGSALAGFVLIPLIGVQGGIALAAGTSLLLGGVLLWAEPALVARPRVRVTSAVVVALMAVGAGVLTGDELILTSFKERVDDETVLFYREGIGSTVKVYQDGMGDRYVSIDGFPVAGTSFGLQDAQKSLGHIPMLLSDVPQARVNLIGFGAGGASWGVLQYDVASVDVVELVPAVLEAAVWFPEINHGVVDEPRFTAIREDGRNYALVTDKVYDVISIDATSPKMAGNGSLYTVDFYRILERRLSQRGMAVQWLPFHLLSDAEMRMTARSFQTVFPHTTVWFSPIRHHALLIGTREPLKVDLDLIATKLERPGVREELEPMGVREATDVMTWFIMGEEGVARYAQGAALNTDNHPLLEFTPAMAYFYTMKYVTENLYALGMARESPWPILVDRTTTDEERAAFKEAVDTRMMANQHTVSGDIFYYLGLEDKARGEYAMGLLLDPKEKNWAHPVWAELRNPAPVVQWW